MAVLSHRRRFVDCALLYQQQADADERSLCCPPSVRRSATQGALACLLLDRADLPDGHFELVVGRIASRRSAQLTVVVVERSAGLANERVAELLGQEGVDASVHAGEQVEVELRHLAWLIDEQRWSGDGGGGGDGEGRESLSMKEQLRAERRRKEEAQAAMRGGGFVQGSCVEVDAAQLRADEEKLSGAEAPVAGQSEQLGRDEEVAYYL